MTSIDLPALRAALAAMTPGPWRVHSIDISPHGRVTPRFEHEIVADDGFVRPCSGDNVRGIAALRNAAPALLDRLEAAEERVRVLEAALREAVEMAGAVMDMDDFDRINELRAVLSP